MLLFERQVVLALAGHLDEPDRAVVADYVDGSLRAMPEHLRAGVAAESLLLGTFAKVRSLVVGDGDDVPLALFESFPIGLVRQYVRLLRGLVLFAEHELVA